MSRRKTSRFFDRNGKLKLPPLKGLADKVAREPTTDKMRNAEPMLPFMPEGVSG